MPWNIFNVHAKDRTDRTLVVRVVKGRVYSYSEQSLFLKPIRSSNVERWPLTALTLSSTLTPSSSCHLKRFKFTNEKKK